MSARRKSKPRNQSVAKKRSRSSKRASPAEQKQFLIHYDGLDFQAALEYAASLVDRYPNDAFGWKVLGSCQHKLGETTVALESLTRAIALEEGDAQAQHLMARVRYDLGEPESAIKHARKAVTIQSDFAQGHFTLAELLTESDRDKEALTSLDRAESLGYSRKSCLVMRCHITAKRRHYQQAFEIAQELIALVPDDVTTLNSMGNLYKDLGRFDEAEASYRRALALKPDFDTAFFNLVLCQHYNPDVAPAHIRQTLSDHWDAQAELPAMSIAAPDPALADRSIRIGLVSPGFRAHPVGQMITPGLQNVDDGFEFYFYSTNNADDVLTRRLKQVATQWHLVRHLDPQALAEQIAADEIDILFDLSGFGEGERLNTMRRRPAPLIVKWVGGLINTMGMDCYDYLLSDHHETPAGVDEYYAEKLIRLPDDYICYLPAEDAGPITALPAISSGVITLGCFNNPAKINPILLSEWAKIMHALDGSRLFLKGGQYDSPDYCEWIRQVMAENGIASDRIILEGPSTHDELLAAYNRVDIALDTWPYSGGLTTCEAFMMGVPVVTRTGPTFAGRHSATHLINAGMRELVTDNWQGYRDKVVELASDLPNLSVIRACLRRFLTESPVCDAPRFGRHFSQAMRAIWYRHCHGQEPAALDLDARGQAFFAGEVEPMAMPRPQPARRHNGFDWDFEGPIVAVDNGGGLLDITSTRTLLDQQILEAVVFDPTRRKAQHQLCAHESVHYFADNGLGDGGEATLYNCTPDRANGLLKPRLDMSYTPEIQIVSEAPFNTVSLDTLDGLPSIDWLILDDLNDSASILENGGAALTDTLLIQARVVFQPEREQQPRLADIEHWATSHDFRLYRLQALQHSNTLPTDCANRSTGALVAADALLLPTPERLDHLSNTAREKIAFLVTEVYGLHDLAHEVLHRSDEARAEQYLDAFLRPKARGERDFRADPLLSRTGNTPPITGIDHDAIDSDTETKPHVTTAAPTLELPDTPHMSPAEVTAFDAELSRASRYFEFGSGGSTVRAVQYGLTVHGVESDPTWVDALKSRLGPKCLLESVDIGETGAWGFPKSSAPDPRFERYSRWIENYDTSFDLVLIDGRFRVACTLAAIRHIQAYDESPTNTRLFIHDFWSRPAYHAVLLFLNEVERVDSAGIFTPRADINPDRLEAMWQQYKHVAD